METNDNATLCSNKFNVTKKESVLYILEVVSINRCKKTNNKKQRKQKKKPNTTKKLIYNDLFQQNLENSPVFSAVHCNVNTTVVCTIFSNPSHIQCNFQ